MKEIIKKYNLPEHIKVRIVRDDDTYFIELPEYDGLFTQADSAGEVFENITDAILTYCDVPRDVAKHITAVYIPSERLPKRTKLTSNINLNLYQFA